MVQRLGRVNRRGGEARGAIVEVHFDLSEMPKKPRPPKKGAQAKRKPRRNTKQSMRNTRRSVIEFKARKEVLHALPRLADGRFDASPGAIVALKQRAEHDPILQDTIKAATTPSPLRPALTRALVDSWSMTSLEEHTGRPDIQPWLRGWTEDDKPQTNIVWRKHLPVRISGPLATKKEINDFFEAAPPHTSEILETETWRTLDWLIARAHAVMVVASKAGEDATADVLTKDSIALMVLDQGGKFEQSLTVGEIMDLQKKENKRDKDAILEKSCWPYATRLCPDSRARCEWYVSQ